MRKASVITTTIDAFRSAINGDALSLRQHPPILPQKDKDFLRKELSQIENDLVTEGVDGELLLNGMLICAGLGDGAQALRYLHRYRKRCFEIPPVKFFEAVALFLNGKECLAQNIIRKISTRERNIISTYKVPYLTEAWFEAWMNVLDNWAPEGVKQQSTFAKRQKSITDEPASTKNSHSSPVIKDSPSSPQPVSPDTKLASLPISIAVKTYSCPAPAFQTTPSTFSPRAVQARYSLQQLKMQRNFEELLCLDTLSSDVQHFWYQVESVKRVLKHFQGRVLFADEVGLGKTIESCMALKEYILRGMVKSCCILTPATLVNQWQSELKSKFGLSFATNYRASSSAGGNINWWDEPWIIASLPTARKSPLTEHLQGRNFDLVIVDEAHHLKNSSSKNWHLVNGLKTRYLFLLSATPLQNNLIELYNLLSLLKPGLFKTELEFRQRYSIDRNKKTSTQQNISELQALMREVMIRNTRALVDVKLPLRHARTIRVQPNLDESTAYTALNSWIVAQQKHLPSMTGRMLLQQAGSAPKTVLAALKRLAAKTLSDAAPDVDSTAELIKLWEKSEVSAKQQAFLALILKNPAEKKLVFVQFRETIDSLATLLQKENIQIATFHGSLSADEKATNIAAFKNDATVLLCTESAGEGHNLQFCNTLINFDIPWNPQIIEQRIGRLHRIGKEREVFIFNLALENTIEARILHILDEKLNMFELVVGEMQAILGEIEDEGDLSTLIYDTWCEESTQGLQPTLDKIEAVLRSAQERYADVKELSDKTFGRELEVV